MNLELRFFTAYVALAYHEARNVWKLANRRDFEKEPYRLLIDGMSTDRRKAWQELKPHRDKAACAMTATEVEAVFQIAFNLSLENLVQLSKNRGWRGTGCGGLRWAKIDRAVIELRDSMVRGDKEGTAEQLRQIPRMQHNHGTVCEKLLWLELSQTS
jgi:hypothetical protein